MSSFSLPESMYEHVLRQGSQHSTPHPRSSHDGRSQFGGTIMSSYSSPRSVHEHVPRQGSQHSIPHPRSSHDGQSQFGNAIMSPYSSPGSVYSEHVLRQGSQRDTPHPRSNYDGQSQFGQRSLHSDQHNPETRPAEYAYTQQSPNPTQTYYSNVPAPDRPYHSGIEPAPPVSRQGTYQSSISASHHSLVVSQSALSNGPRAVPELVYVGPLNYTLVPQSASVGSATFLFPPIEFKPMGLEHPGIFIGRTVRAQHTIESSTFQMSRLIPLPEITIKIRWPGYRFPFERRIANVGQLTCGELLDVVCGVVVEYVQALKDNHVKTTREHSQWAITGTRGLSVETFFVAQLHNLGGNYFQPEIWVPRRSEK